MNHNNNAPDSLAAKPTMNLGHINMLFNSKIIQNNTYQNLPDKAIENLSLIANQS